MIEIPVISRSRVLIVAGAAGVVSGLCLAAMIPIADGASPRPSVENPPAPSAAVRAIDADRDGIISSAEIAGAPRSLRTLDHNGDGRLTADELYPSRGRSVSVDPVVAALDADRDGWLSGEEIGHAVLLRTLDHNRDGRLTADETSLTVPPERGKGTRPERRRTSSWARA